MPPSVPVCAPSSNGESLLMRSFGDVIGGLDPCPFPLPRRPQLITEISSWSCAAVVKKRLTAHEKSKPGTEEGTAGSDPHVGSPQEGEIGFCHRQTRHPAVQTLPISPPACCVIISEPTNALAPELAFPKVMLYDRLRRDSPLVCSATRATPIGAGPDLLWSAVSSDAMARRCSTGGGIGIGGGRSLLELFPRRESTRFVRSGHASGFWEQQQQQQQQRRRQRFESITLDLDEEAFAEHRSKTFSNGVANSSSDRLQSTDAGGGADFEQRPEDAREGSAPPLTVPRSTWDALDLYRLLQMPWPMHLQRRSAAVGGALLPFGQATGVPPPVRIEVPTEPRRSRRLHELATSGDLDKPAPAAGGDWTVYASLFGDTAALTATGGQSVGSFTRINFDGPAGDEYELILHDSSSKVRVGLLGLLGNLLHENQIDAAAKARYSPLACRVDPQRGFDPRSPPSVGYTLFPGRCPLIPLAARARSAAKPQLSQHHHRQQQRDHKPGVAGAGRSRSGSSGSGNDVDFVGGRDLLAPLWTALRQADHLRPSRDSSQSLLWTLTPRRQLAHGEGRRLSFVMGSVWGGAFPARAATWSPKPTSTRTDKLLEAILASWREAHAPPPPQPVRAVDRGGRQRRQGQQPPPPFPLPSQPSMAVAQTRPPPPPPPSHHQHVPPTASSSRSPQAAPSCPPARASEGHLAAGAEEQASQALAPAGYGRRAQGSSAEAPRPAKRTNREKVAYSSGKPRCKARLNASDECRAKCGPPFDSGQRSHGGAAFGTAPAGEEGEGTPASCGKAAMAAPLRGKRKLGGALWAFTAAGNGAPGAQPPSGPGSGSRPRESPSSEPDGGVRMRLEDRGGALPLPPPLPMTDRLQPQPSLPTAVVSERTRHSRSEASYRSAIDAATAAAPALSSVAAVDVTAALGKSVGGNAVGSSAQEDHSVASALSAAAAELSRRLPAPPAKGTGRGRAGANTGASMSLHAGQQGRGSGGGFHAAEGQEQERDEQELEGDAAMARCESSRQKEMLALIRAGKVGETFFLLRGQGFTAPDSSKRWRQLGTLSPPRGSKEARLSSEAGGGAGWETVVGGVQGAFSSSEPGAEGPWVQVVSPLQAAAKPAADRPLYAVVSEDFVDKAGKVVLALSTPKRSPPHSAAPPTPLAPMRATGQNAAASAQSAVFRRGMQVKAVAGNAAAAAAVATVPRGGRFHLLELTVERPVDLVVGGRSAVVILDSRGDDADAAAGADTAGSASTRGEDGRAPSVTAEGAEAKEKLRLLQLQTLKYSTIWLVFQMGKDRTAATATARGLRLRPALEKLEQWLVGFPCRVLIRYSYNDTQLAELITHAAVIEQRGSGSGATAVGAAAAVTAAAHRVQSGAKRRRTDVVDTSDNPRGGGEASAEAAVAAAAVVSRKSTSGDAAAGCRSPLEATENRCRDDSEWAAFHHRQAWFLQLFPTLNAFSASALLSSASLKHLIVSPYEELAPALLGARKGCSGGAAGGGVTAESLRDFCDTIRFEGGFVNREV